MHGINLVGGYKLGSPSVLAAGVENMAKPRGITATLCFGVEANAQVANLARVQVIASQYTDVLASNEDVGADWYRRRWKRRGPPAERNGYFDL
jgi:hypothetical protein